MNRKYKKQKTVKTPTKTYSRRTKVKFIVFLVYLASIIGAFITMSILCVNVIEKKLQNTIDTQNTNPAITENNDVEEKKEGKKDIIVADHVEATKLTITPYAYNHFSENEKILYMEIYDILTSLGENIDISTTDSTQVKRVFNGVLMDHPEIYYVSGYSLTKYTKNGEINKYSLTGSYTATAEEIATYNVKIEDSVKECFLGLSKNANDYEKVKYVYEYIINHTDYDLKSSNNQNILSVLINHKSVCKGYAKTTQYLLNRLGIFCTFVEGNVQNGEAHAWNIVKIGTDYYHVDTTWGDASYTMMENVYNSKYIPDINYDYLCVTDIEISKTHTVNRIVQLPACTSLRDNYYVKEGYYFYDFDINENKLEMLFNDAYKYNKKNVTIKCSVPSIYNMMYKYLITEGNVFNYLKNAETVQYIKMKEQNTIIIYI